MTDHPRLEVPFDVVAKWEEIEGSCARFYAAAEWGYKQALATPPPEPPTDEELRKLWLDLYATNDGPTSGEVVTIARAVLERWGRA
jgi:hypothetical protein